MSRSALRSLLVPVLCLCCLAGLLAGCKTSGPEGALNNTAKALTDKNSSAFLAQIDMDAFASHELVNLKQDVSTHLLRQEGGLPS